VVDKYFTWTPTRIEGIGLEIYHEEASRHARAYPDRRERPPLLVGGDYQWRNDGEFHLFNPDHHPQAAKAVRGGDVYAATSLQGVLRRWSTTRKNLARCAGCSTSSFAPDRSRSKRSSRRAPSCKRFKTGAMSYGSISKEAHETLAIAMNRIGGKSNTGEGGEDPERYTWTNDGRLQEQRHQAGGVGPLRRHQRVSGQRQGDADQDGAGRQAGRGRAVARRQGLPVDRQGAPLDAGRGADLAAPAPRHLFHRGPGGADPRPEERQPRTRASASSWSRRWAWAPSPRAWPRARRRDPDFRPRRRHGRVAADEHQARRAAVGTGAGRDAPDAGAQQPAQPRVAGDRRPAQDRARRGIAALLGAEEFGFATAPLVAWAAS
jgi:hypothetical protein